MTGGAAPSLPDTIVFDLGNVLLDWNVERILESLDSDPAERDLLRRELFAHPDWLALDSGRATEAEVIERISRRSSLRPASVERALAAARDSLRPIPETLRLVRDIAAIGKRLLCLSNMSRETWAHIRDLECLRLFEGIVISGIEGCVKPDEGIFRLLIERHALSPQRSLFIDDSLANVEAAERLGINGFHFQRSPACYSSLRTLIF